MFFYLILWTLYSDAVLAASLPRRSEIIGSLAARPISPSNLLSPANMLASSSNTSSSGNLLKIACDGTKYGKNLKVNSCRSVFNFMMKNETQFTFAERDSGVPSDISLPLRTLSSKTSIDASASWIHCPATRPANTIDLTLTHEQQTTDCASFSQFYAQGLYLGTQARLKSAKLRLRCFKNALLREGQEAWHLT